MQIHIFDTHVMTNSGQYIHFDVLVDNDNIKQVEQYAKKYLASLNSRKFMNNRVKSDAVADRRPMLP